MPEVWDKQRGREVYWNGDPQNQPDTCETCDGAGRVYILDMSKFVVLPGAAGVMKPVLSTDRLPDDEECPECKGCGMVY